MNYKKLVVLGVGLFLLALSIPSVLLSAPKASAATPGNVSWLDAKTLVVDGKNYTYSKVVKYTCDSGCSGNIYAAVFVEVNPAVACAVPANTVAEIKVTTSYGNGSNTVTDKYKLGDIGGGGASVIVIPLGRGVSSYKGDGTDKPFNADAGFISFNQPAPNSGDTGCQLNDHAQITIGNQSNSSIRFNWVDQNTITDIADGWVYKNHDPSKPKRFYKTPPNAGICASYVLVHDTDPTLGDNYAGLDHSKDGYKQEGNCWYKNTGTYTIGQVNNSSNPGDANAPPANTIPGCTDTDSNGNCKNSNDILNCNSGSGDWIICPAITLGAKAANSIDGFIMDNLDIDVSPIFDNTDKAGTPANGYYTAWSSFRIIAIAILVIGGLIMVASQALGFEFLDAYTIRKTLPRLLVAIIGISLSWPLMKLAVSFFDTAGIDIRQLIYGPFGAWHNTITSGAGFLSSAAVIALFIAMGPASLTFIITALLSVLIGYLILVLRKIAIVMLIIVAPVAIACYILPGTQKMWKLWWDNFLGLLLMFPIISALIAAGHVFSAVALPPPGAGTTPANLATTAFAIIAYFLPYFLLPMVARMVSGAIGTLTGMVNDRSKGIFDRLSKRRGEAVAHNMHAMRNGNRFKGGSFPAKAFNATTRNLANVPNAGFIPWKARSRMQAAAATHESQELAEYMEKNPHFSSVKGNDDYLQATMKNMGGGRKESDWRRYLSGMGYEGRALEQGVAAIRAAKRDVSDEVFEKAAVVANASTGTGWKQGGGAKMMESIIEASGKDRHTGINMLAQMRGAASQSGRLDLAGSGFGNQARILNSMYDDVEAGQPLDMKGVNQGLYDNAIFTKGAGEYIRARGDAVRNMAPEMFEHLKRSHQNLETAYQTGNAASITNAERALAQDYAAFENIHDQLSYAAPENARIIADSVMGQVVGQDPNGKDMTVLDQIRALQGGDDRIARAYRETRRTYSEQVDRNKRREEES